MLLFDAKGVRMSWQKSQGSECDGLLQLQLLFQTVFQESFTFYPPVSYVDGAVNGGTKKHKTHVKLCRPAPQI